MSLDLTNQEKDDLIAALAEAVQRAPSSARSHRLNGILARLKTPEWEADRF
jgi:hypothetical protein